MKFKKIKNTESSFTELFSILKCYKKTQFSNVELSYESNELVVLHQHVNNAIDTLLLGLQDVGQLIGLAGQSKESTSNELSNIGFFISAISNLTEALNTLRADASFVLEQRKYTATQ